MDPVNRPSPDRPLSSPIETSKVESPGSASLPQPEANGPGREDFTRLPLQAEASAARENDSDPDGFVKRLEAKAEQTAVELQALSEQHSALTDELRESRALLRQLRESRDTANQRAKDAHEKAKAARATYLESRDKLVSSLTRTRESLQNTSSLWKQASRYYSLFWQGLLADEVTKSDVDLSADTYLCLLPSTVPAAMELRRKYGGRIICDCVENVEVERHSLAPNLHPPTLDMINMVAYGALSSVDGMMTVSNAVERTLHRFGPPVRVQQNFRRHEVPTPSGKLRETFGLPSDARVLVASGGIVSGFEAVVDAMKLLPADIHLVTFAKFSAAGYDEKIRDYVADTGLDSRVHLGGFVPYEELSSLLADADLGMIVLDPTNPNHSVSLPNRVFDFTTAALPFVAPSVAEISDYIDRFQCGVTIREVTPASWAAGVMSALENLPQYRDAIVNARSNATWESLDDGLVEFLGNPSSVTLLGFRDLSRYQRFLRVADSLTQRGIQVKAAFFSKDPRPIDNKDAEFYYFSERYGRGPGLMAVPKSGEDL